MAIATEVFANEGRMVEREMSVEELAEIEQTLEADRKTRLAAQKATSEAKAALLVKLGITAEEAALLLA